MDIRTRAAVVAGRQSFHVRADNAVRGVNPASFDRDAKLAFDRVANPRNWKLAVDAVVEADAREAGFISAAVGYYTGMDAEVAHVGGRAYRLTAPGYYAVVGA